MSAIQKTIYEAMKTAMRAKDKPRLSIIRLMQSEFKRIEVDERIELDDARVLGILDKMVKQRRDSLSQFTDAGRTDLADQEQYEIEVIKEYLPTALTKEEIAVLVDDALDSVETQGMQAMGQVMAMLKPQLQGRADMGQVGRLVRGKLV